MTFRLTVAGSMEALLDPVVAVLSRPLADPFAAEVVAVPGDGVRSWLTARLAERLGVSGPVLDRAVPHVAAPDAPGVDGVAPDGAVANIRFVFPSALVAEAIGEVAGREGPDPWAVGSLTWTIHALLTDERIVWRYRPPGRTDVLRCRALADLFDRYALHRSLMVQAWEAGRDVDAELRPLPEHLRWQAELWRLVRARLGVPSPAEVLGSAAAGLRAGRLDPSLPERVLLVGLAGLPAPHLHVLSALSQHRDLHVFAPAPSTVVWERVLHSVTAAAPRPPVPRAADPTSAATEHPLGSLWGRAAREAHLLLASAAVESGAEIERVAPVDPPPAATLLARLQHDLRGDRPPPGAPPPGGPAPGASSPDASSPDASSPGGRAPGLAAVTDTRMLLDPDDTSVRWHTCHGPARQVEVARDVVLHLLQERRPDGSWRYEPRDIVVLCPDVPTVAPLLEAAFAGDPARGLPQVPLRVADRSLPRQNPLVDVTLVLLDLLDGRLRASEVLGFAQSEPVARRFGFDADQLERLAARVADTHVHWGADPDAQRAVGLPDEVDAHTWRHGLDQLLVSVALADPAIARAAGDPVGDDRRIGPSGVAALPDAGADDLVLAGSVSAMLAELDAAIAALTTDATVEGWCNTLLGAVDGLFAVSDPDAWQRRDLEREIAAVADEAAAAFGAGARTVPADELAALVADRLGGRPGRVRFDTGAVTVSSLTAQRGVPHRVVCLLGLDGDLGAVGAAPSDDLTQAVPCVGDRDPRVEVRAQLLDALLAAGDRLVVLSNGRDIRNNAAIPPAVPLAELADLIDATARTSGGGRSSASAAITVEHPRQAWSEHYFVAETRPGTAALTPRPWGLDRGALDAARVRRARPGRPEPLATPLAADPLTAVRIDQVARTLRNPAQTLLRDRLGVQLDDDAEPWSDLVPLELDGLATWHLRTAQLEARLAAGPGWDGDARARWVDARRREGALPPMALADGVVAEVDRECDALIEAFRTECAEVADTAPVERAVDLDLAPILRLLPSGSPASPLQRLQGVVPGVRGPLLVHLSPSRPSEHTRLATWFRLAVLVALEGSAEPRAVIIARPKSGKKPYVERLGLRSVDAAHEALAVVLDLHARSRCDLVPAFPATTRAVFEGRTDRAALDRASEVWRPVTNGRFSGGEGIDPWVVAAWGELEFTDLLAVPARPDDPGTSVVAGGATDQPIAASRLVRWADRLWGTFEATVAGDVDAEADGDEGPS